MRKPDTLQDVSRVRLQDIPLHAQPFGNSPLASQLFSRARELEAENELLKTLVGSKADEHARAIKLAKAFMWCFVSTDSNPESAWDFMMAALETLQDEAQMLRALSDEEIGVWADEIHRCLLRQAARSTAIRSVLPDILELAPSIERMWRLDAEPDVPMSPANQPFGTQYKDKEAEGA